MKKTLRWGLVSLFAGVLVFLFVLGGGFVGADTELADPSAQIFKLLLYFGGGLLVLGFIMVISATLTLKK